MPEYTLIIRDILAGNKEVVVDSIVLSGLYEQHPKDFFESQTVVGLANREILRKNLQEKLYRSEISADILEYIIAEWCQGIKEHYKRRFMLPLEIPYTQSSIVANPIETKTPQHTEIPNPNIKVVDRKKSGISSLTKKQELEKQDTKSENTSQSVQETEPQISSRAATDKWSID
ncbi:hypothetical protein NIES2100_73420 [Calothrix sp. NIES-2100]|uniref:hypothetical protein n=1 Tax=Calothrix sp. NIES-2100 TaxID=1954172 RepID=UPI000B5E9C6B|nr:hypothetical protein NIES2100_73420 [Calothrix sp. NIES-2100]